MDRYRVWYRKHRIVTAVASVLMTVIYLALYAIDRDSAQGAGIAYLVGLLTVVVMVELGRTGNRRRR